jgi:hypothetical protein
MGFVPSFAEPDIWMRDNGDHYEYIATYVDDLTIASRDPSAIIESLQSEPNNFKLKGTGEGIEHEPRGPLYEKNRGYVTE